MPGDPYWRRREEAERQERAKRRLLLIIGMLIGLIAFVLLERYDPFGMGG